MDRDIKPENCIYGKHEGRYVLKLADFGLGVMLEGSATVFVDRKLAGV